MTLSGETETTVKLEVDEHGIGQRLDSYAAAVVEGLSRSRVQALLSEGNVLLNGKPAKASLRLSGGDLIEITVPPPVKWDVKAEDIPLDIVYEDERILVINKDRGVVVHPAAGHRKGTLVNAILNHCPDLKGVGGEIRPGIVHRLDKDTTGLLVVAKDEEALCDLQGQIKDRTAKREYLALCKGRLSADSGTVEAPIARDQRNRKRMAVRPGGREAVTAFEVVTRFGNEYTLLVAKLRTGRTHQIRVHMAHLRHPVVGDSVYSRTKGELGMNGQALHAFKLGFVVPESGRFVEFSVPLPDDFREALGTLERRYKEELPVWLR